jgi:hypothetical protein
MWQPGRDRISVARTPWREALDHPGSFQMGHLRRLFTQRPFHRLVPDQELIVGGPGAGADHARAALADDFAVLYLPTGGSHTVNTGKLGGRGRAWWFNPRQGTAEPAGEFNGDTAEFTAPYSGRNNDWVLVLDRAGANLPDLGTP